MERRMSFKIHDGVGWQHIFWDNIAHVAENPAGVTIWLKTLGNEAISPPLVFPRQSRGLDLLLDYVADHSTVTKSG